MQGPRSIKKEELTTLEKLTNSIFRSGKPARQTMFQEYPGLYSSKNISNIRVILEDGKIISNINYLPEILIIKGYRINAAVLGGVFTLPEYRGKGYSTLLLNDCINRMKEQNIKILHISGDRAMYRKAGSMPAGQIFDYDITTINCPKEKNGIHMKEYEKKYLPQIHGIYSAEDVRYERTPLRMDELICSRKFSSSKKTVLFSLNDIVVGYLIFSYNSEDKTGRFIEWAGNKLLMLKSMGKIFDYYDISKINLRILPHEHELHTELVKSNAKFQAKRLGGTICVLDFPGFMQSMKSYFIKLYSQKFIDLLEFRKNGSDFFILNNEARFSLSDKEQLNNLIFGGGTIPESSFSYTGKYMQLMGFINTVFPIPFLDTDSLSCV